MTKDVIPAYAQYMIATKASKAALFAIIAISLLVLARFAISKSKKYANWEKESTSYKRSEAKDYHEAFKRDGYASYILCIIFVFFVVVEIITFIPWIISPYGAFVSLLVS